MISELVLLYAVARPPQQAATILQPDHLVALVMDEGRTELKIELTHAQVLYEILEQRKSRRPLSDLENRFYAALTIALGTLPDAQRLSVPLLGTRERLDWEVRRGVRLPTQDAEGVTVERKRKL